MDLLVQGSWTYAARGELRERGFRWDPKRRGWKAPNVEARDRAIAELSGTVLNEWSLTVHGDAGWKDGIGRWAWYVRWGRGRVEGRHEGRCPSVAEAEARSLWYGLAVGLEQHEPRSDADRRVVFLRNDNLDVVRALKGEIRLTSEAVGEILQLCEDHRIDINAKHVKGHQRSSNSVAAWVNNRVDKLSNMRNRDGLTDEQAARLIGGS